MTGSFPRPRRVFVRRTCVVALGLLAVAALLGSWAAAWPARVVLELDDSPLRPLAFSPDGRILLTSGDSCIVPWDVRTGAKGKPRPLAEGSWVSDSVCALSADGRTFAAAVFVADRYWTIEVFDVASGKSRRIFSAEHDDPFLRDEQGNRFDPRHLAFSIDGTLIKAIFGPGLSFQRSMTWDTSTGRETSRRSMTALDRSYALAITKDGRLAALMDGDTGEISLRDLDADRPHGPLLAMNYREHELRSLRFSPDGKSLAACREDGSVEFWDLATGRLLKSIPVHRGGYEPLWLEFSPDGRLMLSHGEYPKDRPGNAWVNWAWARVVRAFPSLDRPMEDEVVAVEIATGEILGRARSSKRVVASPDGRTVATQGLDGTVSLRDLPAR